MLSLIITFLFFFFFSRPLQPDGNNEVWKYLKLLRFKLGPREKELSLDVMAQNIGISKKKLEKQLDKINQNQHQKNFLGLYGRWITEINLFYYHWWGYKWIGYFISGISAFSISHQFLDMVFHLPSDLSIIGALFIGLLAVILYRFIVRIH